MGVGNSALTYFTGEAVSPEFNEVGDVSADGGPHSPPVPLPGSRRPRILE